MKKHSWLTCIQEIFSPGITQTLVTKKPYLSVHPFRLYLLFRSISYRGGLNNISDTCIVILQAELPFDGRERCSHGMTVSF